MKPLNFKPISWRPWFLILIVVLAIGALLMQGPIAQDSAYHDFADQRTLLGVPNFWNVVSNLPFLVVGVYGLVLLYRYRGHDNWTPLRLAYAVLFLGLILVAVGSAYYHLGPDNQTLVWDRLPMTVAFMAFFATIMAERIHPDWVRLSLVPLVLAGVFSVLWWQSSGDLRPYVLVQFLPVVLIPAVICLYPVPGRGLAWVWAVLVFYAIAKVFELFDAPIYSVLGMSGHSLKHIAAAIGVYFIALLFKARMAHSVSTA